MLWPWAVFSVFNFLCVDVTRINIDLSTAADCSQKLILCPGDLLFTIGWSDDYIFQFRAMMLPALLFHGRCQALAASPNGQKEKRRGKGGEECRIMKTSLYGRRSWSNHWGNEACECPVVWTHLHISFNAAHPSISHRRVLEKKRETSKWAPNLESLRLSSGKIQQVSTQITSQKCFGDASLSGIWEEGYLPCTICVDCESCLLWPIFTFVLSGRPLMADRM